MKQPTEFVGEEESLVRGVFDEDEHVRKLLVKALRDEQILPQQALFLSCFRDAWKKQSLAKELVTTIMDIFGVRFFPLEGTKGWEYLERLGAIE